MRQLIISIISGALFLVSFNALAAATCRGHIAAVVPGWYGGIGFYVPDDFVR